MTNWNENKAKLSTYMPFQKTISDEKQVSLNIACWIFTLGVDVLFGLQIWYNGHRQLQKRSANHGGKKEDIIIEERSLTEIQLCD